MVAPGTTRPVLSVMRPRMVPLDSCDQPGWVAPEKTIAAPRMARRRLNIEFLQFGDSTAFSLGRIYFRHQSLSSLVTFGNVSRRRVLSEKRCAFVPLQAGSRRWNLQSSFSTA